MAIATLTAPTSPATGAALAAARCLLVQAPGLARLGELTLAAFLRRLVEEALDPEHEGAPEAPHGLGEGDAPLVLLEAERLLEEVLAEDDPDSDLAADARARLRRRCRAVSRQLEETGGRREQALVGAVLEELPETIVLVGEDERVAYANANVRDTYGLEPHELVGRPLAELFTVPSFLVRLEQPDQFLDSALCALDSPGKPHEQLFRSREGATYLQRVVPAGPAGGGRLVITANVTRLRRRNDALSAGAEPHDEPGFEAAPAPPMRPRLRVIRGGRPD